LEFLLDLLVNLVFCKGFPVLEDFSTRKGGQKLFIETCLVERFASAVPVALLQRI